MAESPLHGALLRPDPQDHGGDPAGRGWHARGQNGLRIPRRSASAADLAVVRGDGAGLPGPHPEASDVALVAEVSVSSLAEDRAMAEIYAAGGMPFYWIINVDDGQVEVYSDPDLSGYRKHEVLAPGHVLSVVIDGVELGEIAVADILPRGT